MSDQILENSFVGQEIVIERGQDYIIEEHQKASFESINVLGKGYSGFVEGVRHTKTKEVFARKAVVFPRAKFREQAQDCFLNEVSNIRSLGKHPHIIQVFAAYTTQQAGFIILEPAANQGNLEDYLHRYSQSIENPGLADLDLSVAAKVLKQAFGCLSGGLAFIHEKGIRHKDIKPANILVHKDLVIFADFGTSKDTAKDGQCTTEGRPEFLTRKYAPPEVLDHEKRNFAADVYSLGCVFLELLYALDPTVKHDEPEGEELARVLHNVHTALLSAQISPELSLIPEIVVSMTLEEPGHRSEASGIATTICMHSRFSCFQCQSKRMISSEPNLSQTYSVKQGREAHDFFVQGRVFASLWSEPASITLRQTSTENSTVSLHRFGEGVYSQIRRFVVVKVNRAMHFVYACAISTYGGRGTLKPGCNASEHTIVHLKDQQPLYLAGEWERGMRKEPIQIDPTDSNEKMLPASRLRLGKIYSIEWNTKVREIGKVSQRDMSKLIRYYKEESEKGFDPDGDGDDAPLS